MTSHMDLSDLNCRVRIWEARAKLHWRLQDKNIGTYLGCSLEAIRECFFEGYSEGKVGRRDRVLLEDTMHWLTSLRYSDPYNPKLCYAHTQLQPATNSHQLLKASSRIHQNARAGSASAEQCLEA